ncbi:hypothetical protein [Paraburkholderia unamae]|uniref:HK97 gp10 family phage protein n=1 Tax=Paraburkholderia unamae TaxID=219649 RepID=A0ABX5KAH6_9BURK|nr:hypothetical protein [Paraburkholderia unamae]PVX71835.1 hypothetical protein C7402_12798 [Paraburkholderia unamae]RAR52011.1 hypothetical protein C7401_1343 [Paraburkholderia unamae]
MGKKLDAARRELDLARSALAKMETASDVEEFDLQWKEVLGRLTRLWNKTQASLKGDPRFTNAPQVKAVQSDLKSDPLVQYLARARDADEHRSEDITGKIEAGVRFEFDTPKGKLFMRAPNITLDDGTELKATVRGASREYFAPAEVYAVTVNHRGKAYAPPNSHAGRALEDMRPITLARLGIEYYERFLESMARDGWDVDVK